MEILNWRALYVLGVLLLISFTVVGQEQQETEEGFRQVVQELPFTEAVYLQEKRELQATLSYYHADNEFLIGNSFSFELEYGLADWLQLSAELEDSRLKRSTGKRTIYQLEAGTMVRLLNSPQQAASFAFNVEFPINKPSGAAEAGEETETAYIPSIIYARQLGNTQLHLAGGAELQADERDWFYQAALVYGDQRLHPLLDITGTYQEEANWYVGTGLILNSKSGWELVTGVRHSLVNPDWDVSVRLLYEFYIWGISSREE